MPRLCSRIGYSLNSPLPRAVTQKSLAIGAHQDFFLSLEAKPLTLGPNSIQVLFAAGAFRQRICRSLFYHHILNRIHNQNSGFGRNVYPSLSRLNKNVIKFPKRNSRVKSFHRFSRSAFKLSADNSPSPGGTGPGRGRVVQTKINERFVGTDAHFWSPSKPESHPRLSAIPHGSNSHCNSNR